MKNNLSNIKRFIVQQSFLFIGFSIVLILLIVLILTQSTFDTINIPLNQVVRIHYADNISDTHLKLINEFNEKYRNRIKVIPINLPFSKFSTNERKELLARSLRSKSEKIDVFAVDIIWGYRFAKWAEKLDSYFDEAFRDRLIDQVMPTVIYKNDLIGMPLNIDIGTLYYRDDLLDDFPDHEKLKAKLTNSITWEELIELGKKNKDISPFYIFPAADYEGLICSYFELVLNQDRHFFDGNNFDLTRIESRNAVKLMKDFIYKYKFTPSIVNSYTEYPAHKYYLNKNGLFLRSWPTFISDFKKIFKDKYSDKKVKRAPLPHFNGTKPAMVFGGWNLIVSRFSENKSEAVTFIKFMLEEESQKKLFIGNGILPVVKEVYNKANQIEGGKALQYYKEQFKYGVHRPLNIDYTRISSIMSYYIHKALTNEMTVDLALEEATKMIENNSNLDDRDL